MQNSNFKFNSFLKKRQLKDLNKILNAIQILTFLIRDLEIAIQISDLFIERRLSNDNFPEKQIPPGDYLQLIFYNIILTLCKLIEFQKYYKSILNHNESGKHLEQLINELKKLKITDFRNRYIGHIHDKKTKAPINSEDYEKFFEKIEFEHFSVQNFFLKLKEYAFVKEYTLLEILNENKTTLKKDMRNLETILLQ